MNEEVLQDLFNRAVSKGYNKSIEEFTVLLSQNNDVLIDNFNYVKGKGYKKTIEDFKTLTGVVEGVNTTDSEVKKKDEPVSTSPEEVMDGGTQVVEEPGSLEPSVQEDEVVTEEIEYQPGVDAQGIEMGFSEDYLTTIKKAKDQGLDEYETKARVQSQQLKEDQELETETQWDRSVKSLTQGLEVVDDEFLGWLDNKKKTSRDKKITDSEEEQVRYRMEYLFEDYGYEFEEFGVGDNIKITAPGSEQWVKDNPDAKEEDNPYIFKTDTDSGRDWFNLTKKAVSSVNPGTYIASNLLSDTSEDGKSYELAQFMERTKPASALSRNRMDEIIADNSIYNSKVMNMEQEDEIKKAHQTDNDEMVMDTNDFLERYNEAQKEGEYFSQFTPLEIKQKGLEQQYGEFLNLREQLKVEGKALDERMEGLKEDGPSLDLAVGEYIKSREKIGDTILPVEVGAAIKSISKGYGTVFAGATGLAIDITSAKYAALLIATGMPAKDAYAQADAWSKKTKGFGKGGGSYTPFSKVANQYVSQDQKGLQQLIRDRGSEVADKIGTETSDEFFQSDDRSFVETSLYGVAESVPAMMTGVGGLFTMAVDIVNQETENNPLFKDISELEKLAIAAPIGVVGAALERVGLSKALKGRAFTQQATLYMLKKFGAKATTKSFSEFVDYEMRTGGAKLLTKSLMGGLSEAETGGLQEVSDKVFKNIYNEIKGQELFQETDTWAQFFYEVGEAAVAEGIGGTAIGSVGSVVNGATGGNFGEVSNETFALFKDLMNDPYLKGAYEIKIKRKIITGEITKAEAKRQMQAAEVIAGVMSEIPDSYSEDNQRKALQLLLEKKALEDKISKSNKLLVKGLQDRVDVIDNSLESIGEANDLAVELMSDEEVDLPQEIKDLNDDEVYTFTVENLEDVPESQRGNAEKVEGAEITTRQTILGIPVGPETTIKSGGGYTYTITGKEAKINANAIQESSTKDVDVQEPSTDSGKVGEGDTEVQPSVTGETQEEGESESDTTQTAEEKIEAAEDARKLFEEEMGEAGTGPVSEPETVLPKVTPEKLEPVVSDENLSITEEVDGESDPYYETEEFSSSPEGGVTAKQHENRILKRAEKAVKAIKKILPKTKIILHRSEAAYNKAINAKEGDTSGGSYVYNNKDGTGTIHVNVPRANKRTIAHEVFHAVLISKYKGNEAEIRSITKRMLAAVKKNVKDRALKNRLQEFSDGYEKFNDEEYLAELVGFLGDNYDSLGPKGKNIIKRWLEKIGEILGREPEINVDADVLELLNTIGKSVKRGEEIQGDVIDKSFSQIETETKINWTKKKSAPQKSSPSKIKQIQEKLRTLVKKYESGKITIEEYNKQADDIIPVKMKEVFVEPVNEEELIDGLKSKKDKTNSPIQEGTDVSLRIDIPFMKRTGKSSVTIHERRSPKDITGRVLSYVGSAVIENVEFLINPKQSLAFASDNKVHKSANLGRMGGTLVDIGSTIEEQNATAKKLAQQAISEGWTQVGINPSKHSYFYDRSTGKPLKSADRVVQVGDLIYAENAKTTTVYDDMFIVKGKTDKKGGPLRFQKPTQRQQKVVNEPSAVVAEDGWTFVRMTDGSYTDGDQIYSSWDELKKVSEEEGLNLKQASKSREEDVRARETVQEIQDDILKKTTQRQQKVNVFEGGKFVDNPSTALRQQRIGNFEVTYTENEKIAEYVKDGRVTQPENLDSLRGLLATITSPDDMMAGELSYENKEGVLEVIFEGEGGVFFVTKFGDVWASGKEGTANTITNSLNKQLDAGQKKAYLVLTKGTDSKLVSSASGVNSTLEVLNLMLDKKLISPSLFRSAVTESIKKERAEVIKKAKAAAKKKKVKYIPIVDNPIDFRSSAKDLKADVKKFFTDTTTSTFMTRGNIVKNMTASIIKGVKAEKDKKKITAISKFIGGDEARSVGVNKSKVVGGTQGFTDLLATLVAEKLTKGLNIGDVYAVIEVDSKVKTEKSSHPSYPFHVVQENGKPPVLILPKNREAGKNLFKPIYGKDEKTGESLNNPYSITAVSVVDGVFEEQPTTQRQQRTIQQVARMYNMTENGYFPKNVDTFSLKKAVANAEGNYSIRKAKSGSFFLSGSRGIVKDLFKRPQTTQRQQRVVRLQKTIKKSDTPIDIIKKAVALGIDQKVVLNDLLKNYSTLNAKQRKELLAVNIDLFTSVPDAFLNVKGGYKKGIALLKRLMIKLKSLMKIKIINSLSSK